MKLILSEERDRNSEVFFISRYMVPAIFLALIPAMYLYLSNLHSINFALETHVFVASMILTSVILFNKIKNMKIIYKKDHLGFAWPDDFNRFVNLMIFSVLVSVMAVWGALEINQIFDKSNPKEITG